MKAAIFVGPGHLELREIETPHAAEGELVLRVGANTVCGTDGRILRGEKSKGIDRGVVLGHEVSGYVTEIGKGVTGFAEGDLVGLVPTIPCLRCYYCQHGMEHLCTDSLIVGYRVNGGLADFIKIPREAVDRKCVFKAAEHLTAAEVSLAEPLGCVLNGASQYQTKIGDVVLILGAGPIGLLHAQLNKQMGASKVIVSDPSAGRREIATSLGATHTVDPTQTDLSAFVSELTDGLGADVVVICIGHGALVNQAFGLARKGGAVNAFAGFSKDSLASVDPNLIHYGELKVTGASNASRANHKKALRLIGEGIVDVKSLHTHTFALDDVIEAIEFAQKGDGIKVAVVPEEN
ncbi:alcohol dehydrogenase catalytic domain-containing protein [Actinomycetaceae bacterium L2_0104]